MKITLKKSYVTIVIEDADQVILRDGILAVVKGNEPLCFDWDRVDYYKVKEQEVSE